MTESALLTLPSTCSPRTDASARDRPRSASKSTTSPRSIGTTVLGTSHRQARSRTSSARSARGSAGSSASPTARSSSATAGRPHSGTSPPSAWSASAPSTSRSASSRQVRLGHEQRPLPRRIHHHQGRPHSLAEPQAEAGVDVTAWPHNETSTGVMAPVRRVKGADEGALCSSTPPRARAACRSTWPSPTSTTSARRVLRRGRRAVAGGLLPAALARVDEIAAAGRWVPGLLLLPTAIDNSRKNQTYNTPTVGTLALLKAQAEWLNGQGGLEWAVKRTADSSGRLYDWSRAHGIHDAVCRQPYRSGGRDHRLRRRRGRRGHRQGPAGQRRRRRRKPYRKAGLQPGTPWRLLPPPWSPTTSRR